MHTNGRSTSFDASVLDEIFRPLRLKDVHLRLVFGNVRAATVRATAACVRAQARLAAELPHNQRLKLTGAALEFSRGNKPS